MEIMIGVVLAVIAVIVIIKSHDNVATKDIKKEYSYAKKQCIMTQNELSFYKALAKSVEGCVIVPQAHLSVFLDHKIRSQSWSRAFSRINGKSVDFLICSSEMKPLAAIELDDKTHNQPERRRRDIFVNSIMSSANMPLLRFQTGEWSEVSIKQEIAQAFQIQSIDSTNL